MAEIETIAEPPPPPPPSAATPALRCLTCEYDLRGLPRNAQCPECGMPVEPSAARGDAEHAGERAPLRLSATPWLRATGIACWMTVVFAIMTFAEAYFTLTNIGERTGLNALSVVLGLGQIVVMLVALWLFGAREPLASRRREAGRYVVRALALIVTVLPFALIPLMSRFAGTANFFSRVSVGFAVVAGLLTWLIVRRLAAGARRDRRMMLARAASAFAWLAPVIWIVHAALDPAMPMGQDAQWLLNAHPLVGYAEAVVGMRLLLTSMRTDPLLLPWLLEAAISLTALLLFVAMARLHSAAARQSPRAAAADATSPPPPAAHAERTAASSPP